MVGRFTSVDPIKDGLNWYSYCYNNPVAYIDPSGTEAISLFVYLLAIFGFVFLSGCSLEQPTSDFGAAEPYVEMKGSSDPNSPNCYAYAIGSDVNEQPGVASGRIPADWSDIEDVSASVVEDLIAKGYTVRELNGPNDKVYENEFKIALRVGTTPFAYNLQTGEKYYDYHFMRQTDTGQWAEKHGIGGDSVLHEIGETPDTIPWTLANIPYYDSRIVYFAVGK